ALGAGRSPAPPPPADRGSGADRARPRGRGGHEGRHAHHRQMSTGRPARVVGALARLRPRDVAVVAGIGFLLVRLAFALLVPLGSGPDEPDHFVKAYGATRLDFGSREHVPPMHPKTDMERLNESLATAIDFGDQPTN